MTSKIHERAATADFQKRINNIRDAISSFGSKLTAFDDELGDLVISDSVDSIKRRELMAIVKNSMGKLFGDEAAISGDDSRGLFSFLDYQDIGQERNEFSQSVLFTYWSYVGDRKKYAGRLVSDDPNAPVLTRQNAFYKGRRWSQRNLKEKFYQLFVPISEAAGDLNPIVEFMWYASEGSKESKVIKIECNGFFEASRDNSLRIPTLASLKKSKLPAVKELAEKTQRLRMTLNTGDEHGFKLNVDALRRELGLESGAPPAPWSLMSNAVNSLYAAEKPRVDKWAKTLLETLGAGNEWKNDSNESLVRKLLYVQFLFQFYDNPFDIYMFVPASKFPTEASMKTINRSSLFVTVPVGDQRLVPYASVLGDLAEELCRVSVMDHKIFSGWQAQVRNSYTWRAEYERWSSQYERLTDVATDMLKGLCAKHNISATHIPTRVKEYPSFFNKIAEKANRRSFKNITDSEVKAMAEQERDICRDAIKSASSDGFKRVLGVIRDFAGARVICVYENEAEKLAEEFKKLADVDKAKVKRYVEQTFGGKRGSLRHEMEQVACDCTKSVIKKLQPYDIKGRYEFSSEHPDYRAIHFTFELGDLFTDIAPYEDLKNLRCELQIRTIMADGYAQAHHDTLYKPLSYLNLTDEEDSVPKLRLLFRSLADTCETGDSQLRSIYNILKGVSR